MDKWLYTKQDQQAGAYIFMALPYQKHNAVAGGFHNSFNSENELSQWISQYPEYLSGNVGIDLSKSQLVVIDIDKHKHNGMQSISAWFRAHSINPETIQETYIERTPTGGLHVFYLIASGRDKPKHVINVIDGVDVLSNTAVMTAPSIMKDGEYRQITPFDQIQEAPEWVYQLANYHGSTNTPSNQKTPRYSNKGRGLMVKNGFETGQRNNQAMSLAGYLFFIDVDPQSIYDILQITNNRSSEPLSEDELNTIYMSARKREEQKRARLDTYGRS